MNILINKEKQNDGPGVSINVTYYIPETEVKRIEKIHNKKWADMNLTYEPCSSVEIFFLDEEENEVFVEGVEVV